MIKLARRTASAILFASILILVISLSSPGIAAGKDASNLAHKNAAAANTVGSAAPGASPSAASPAAQQAVPATSPSPAPADSKDYAPGGPLLSLERIFNSREFSAGRFMPLRWMSDGVSYMALEPAQSGPSAAPAPVPVPPAPGSPGAPSTVMDIVSYSARTGGRTVLVQGSLLVPEGETAPLSIEGFGFSDDGRLALISTNGQRVWRQNSRGDYWVFDRSAKRLKKLGAGLEAGSLRFAKISPDGLRAAYVSKNNIYVEDLAAGAAPVALTTDGTDTLINGTFDWVYEEELSLRDGFRWSPDGKRLAFWQLASDGIPDFYLINNTDSLYPTLTDIKYPKAGQTNSACRAGVIDIASKAVTWLKVPGDPRQNYIARMEWAASPDELVLQHINRRQDRNEVMLADARTGDVRTVFVDEDKAWVEPCDDLIFYKGGRAFLFTSERDGWRHFYSVSRDGKEVKLLTPGAYDAERLAGFDETGGWLYFSASPDNPTQSYLFRARLDKPGKPERLTPAGLSGSHMYQLSPTCRYAVHSFSSFTTPSTSELISLPGHKVIKTVSGNEELLAKLNALRRPTSEFFRVDIGDGVMLDGWMLKPPDFDPAKKYPVFFQVYGEPAGLTAADRWGGSSFYWHMMLAQKGYIVASVDNRGTPAPRGREWRKCVYGQIGILASADQAAAVKAMIARYPFIDPDRIGIWGWSGGGSMTLNAMFRYPGIYKVGISVASVPDEHLYDSIYQERYMGLPKDNEEGYRNGSPITYAKQLRGKLLIVHGTGDDNVHYQGFERLVNELIADGKQFTMMSYPNRTHGIYEGRGTTMHLYTLLTDFLLNNLEPGPKAR